MMLRFMIWTLRFSLSLMIGMIVTLLFGRGVLSRRILKGTRILRRIGRL
jgi:hypothetical protein